MVNCDAINAYSVFIPALYNTFEYSEHRNSCCIVHTTVYKHIFSLPEYRTNTYKKTFELRILYEFKSDFCYYLNDTTSQVAASISMLLCAFLYFYVNLCLFVRLIH